MFQRPHRFTFSEAGCAGAGAQPANGEVRLYTIRAPTSAESGKSGVASCSPYEYPEHQPTKCHEKCLNNIKL
jgi:hypothetical protein